MMQALQLINLLILLWFVGLWIAAATYTAVIAEAKGRSFGCWLLGGLIFSLVALIAAAGLPDRSVNE